VIAAMTRHEIQVLRAAGVPERIVAERTAVSVRSVERIVHEPRVTGTMRTTRVGRPSLTAAWAERVAAWLAEDRTLPGMELLRRAQEAGYVGGKSALYELIRRLRPTSAIPVVRFEGVPGEFSQHDFGQSDVRYVDGRTERVHFFASRLKWSRAVDVRLVPNEQEEALVRALLRGFEAFGGIPLVTVCEYVARHIFVLMCPPALCGRPPSSHQEDEEFSPRMVT
jgi:transposase